MFVERALQAGSGNRRPLATLFDGSVDVAEAGPRIPQAPEGAR